MDADVMITIAFALEVVLFALAAAIFVAREARKAGAIAATAREGWPGAPRPPRGVEVAKVEDATRLGTSASRRAGRGVR
jgi:hypothetical protein